MSTDKNTWIEEVMQSLDGAKPAEPGPFLYHRIMQRIGQQKNQVIPRSVVWLAAASFALLLLLNIGAIKSRPAEVAQPEAQQLASQYHLLTTNSISY